MDGSALAKSCYPYVVFAALSSMKLLLSHIISTFKSSWFFEIRSSAFSSPAELVAPLCPRMITEDPRSALLCFLSSSGLKGKSTTKLSSSFDCYRYFSISFWSWVNCFLLKLEVYVGSSFSMIFFGVSSLLIDFLLSASADELNLEIRLSKAVRFRLTPVLTLGSLPLSERELFETWRFYSSK